VVKNFFALRAAQKPLLKITFSAAQKTLTKNGLARSAARKNLY